MVETSTNIVSDYSRHRYSFRYYRLYILLNQGHFKQVSANLVENNHKLESFFVWKGFGKPKVHSVKIKEDNQPEIVALHASAASVEKNVTDSGKEIVEKHQPDISLQLENEKEEGQGISEIVIYYSVFGINRTQELELETSTP